MEWYKKVNPVNTLLVMRRAPGQTLVNLPMKVVFRDFLDGELEGLGYADRSKFIRDAIREKLVAMGKDVPVEFTLPPGRAGKGGRRKTVHPTRTPLGFARNEPINSAKVRAASQFAVDKVRSRHKPAA